MAIRRCLALAREIRGRVTLKSRSNQGSIRSGSAKVKAKSLNTFGAISDCGYRALGKVDGEYIAVLDTDVTDKATRRLRGNVTYWELEASSQQTVSSEMPSDKWLRSSGMTLEQPKIENRGHRGESKTLPISMRTNNNEYKSTSSANFEEKSL
ncbi:hypothetical protein ARMGADRAFT_1093318 [Armillaria gallica]|uniref:Uncharacterized protein n=1 Tax=Armillaria gallica TaxID=47427 RepID=A0A2H3C870_ARMGA|nr:hypothetical protein ARMGADRAFT_1093318 [Armillaria gallica]